MRLGVHRAIDNAGETVDWRDTSLRSPRSEWLHVDAGEVSLPREVTVGTSVRMLVRAEAPGWVTVLDMKVIETEA